MCHSSAARWGASVTHVSLTLERELARLLPHDGAHLVVAEADEQHLAVPRDKLIGHHHVHVVLPQCPYRLRRQCYKRRFAVTRFESLTPPAGAA
eukprot:1919233-Pyramimonas_sp.AAC.1